METMEQVIFPEYIQPLLRSSKYSLALYIYRAPCWNQLFNDNTLSLPQKIDIIERTFARLAMNGLELDLNAFYMLHNIDARQKSQSDVDIGTLVDTLLDQKVGQLDDLIYKREYENHYTTLPDIKTNGLEMNNTKELVEDNKLLDQIIINTVNESKQLEIKNKTFQIQGRKLLGTKSMRHFYQSEEEEDDDEEEEEEEINSNYDFNLNEASLISIENGNLELNELNNKDYKPKKIRYKDRFWNEVAKCKVQNATFDILFINADLDDEDLEQINTNYHGILAFTIQNHCTELFENANIYEGEYFDLLMTNTNLNLDLLINQPSIKANVRFIDKKWKILKFRSDENYERLIKKPKEIKPIKWPKFNFQELNISFQHQINEP